jgi:hypothetical protein
MTLPDERYRAVRMASELMLDLCDPKRTPRVSKEIRQRAASVLRHYPSKWDMDRAAAAAPEVFVERYEDLHRFVLQGSMNDRGELDLEAPQQPD